MRQFNLWIKIRFFSKMLNQPNIRFLLQNNIIWVYTFLELCYFCQFEFCVCSLLFLFFQSRFDELLDCNKIWYTEKSRKVRWNHLLKYFLFFIIYLSFLHLFSLILIKENTLKLMESFVSRWSYLITFFSFLYFHILISFILHDKKNRLNMKLTRMIFHQWWIQISAVKFSILFQKQCQCKTEIIFLVFCGCNNFLCQAQHHFAGLSVRVVDYTLL